MELITNEQYEEKTRKRKLTGKIKIYFPPNYGNKDGRQCYFDDTGLTNEKEYEVVAWNSHYPTIIDDTGCLKDLLCTAFDIVEPVALKEAV
jgi:hypothetical protein